MAGRDGEAGERGEKSIELTGRTKHIDSAERLQDSLHAASFFPAVFDDLQVLATAGTFHPCEHSTRELRTCTCNQEKTERMWHQVLVLETSRPHQEANVAGEVSGNCRSSVKQKSRDIPFRTENGIAR